MRIFNQRTERVARVRQARFGHPSSSSGSGSWLRSSQPLLPSTRLDPAVALQVLQSSSVAWAWLSAQGRDPLVLGYLVRQRSPAFEPLHLQPQ